MKKSNLLKGIVIASLTMLMACSGGGKTASNNSKSLEGTWEIVEAEGSMAGMNVGTQYIFDETSLTFSKDGFDNKANSTHTDSTFTWSNGSMVMNYNYKFKGEQLVAMPQGSDQVFYLDRK